MIGELKSDGVYVNFSTRLVNRNFGKKVGDKLRLTFDEAAYLLSKGSIEIFEKEKVVTLSRLLEEVDINKYLIFEYLRNSGKKIRVEDVCEYILLEEDYELNFNELEKLVGKKIAIVDNESEITFFLISKFDEKGKHKEEIRKITGKVVGNRVISEDVEIFRKYFYGTEKNRIVILSPYESLYLIESGKLELESSSVKDLKKLVERKLYIVYRDLRLRRFMVKTGFKFGSDFRVYEFIRSVNELSHSKYLVKVIRNSITPREIAGDVRLSQSVNKKLIYADVENNEPKYVLVERIKF